MTTCEVDGFEQSILFIVEQELKNCVATTCNMHMVSALLFFPFARTISAELSGISASTGLPYSPPIAFRTTRRPSAGKRERREVQEGKCHKCGKWVAIEGIKDMESKVRFLDTRFIRISVRCVR